MVLGSKGIHCSGCTPHPTLPSKIDHRDDMFRLVKLEYPRCCDTTDLRRAGTLKKLKAVPLVEIGKLVLGCPRKLVNG